MEKLYLKQEGKSVCRQILLNSVDKRPEQTRNLLEALGLSEDSLRREEEVWQSAVDDPYFQLLKDNSEEIPMTSAELSVIADQNRGRYGFQGEITPSKISSNLMPLVRQGLIEVDRTRRPHAYQFK